MTDDCVLVMDVGGSKLAASVGCGGSLRTPVRVSWDGPASSAHALMDTIVAVGARTIATAGRAVTSAVLAVPGLIDATGTRILRCANLPFHDYPMADEIATRLGMAQVALEDDVNCGALGEASAGSARGYPSSVYLSVSTGLSSGVVIGHRLVRGVSRLAGEIGHITVVPDGRLCGCGQRGCLEAYCSGRAFAARARDGDIQLATSGEMSTVSAVAFLADAYAGNGRAHTFVNEALAHLQRAFAWVFSFIDPAVVCVGGGLMNHDGFATDVLTAVAQARPAGCRGAVVRASLGDASVLTGALALATNVQARSIAADPQKHRRPAPRSRDVRVTRSGSAQVEAEETGQG